MTVALWSVLAVVGLLQIHLHVSSTDSAIESRSYIRELTSSSSSSSLVLAENSSYKFDGNNSDIAQQLYRRYVAGDTITKLIVTSDIPEAVIDRLTPFGVSLSDLPGIVQRALLWDTGYVIDSAGNLIKVHTLKGRSMAELAVSVEEFESAGCVTFNCTQADGSLSFNNKYCTGTQMLSVAKCVVEAITDDDGFHAAMWSTGGSDESIPEIILRQHAWEDDSTDTPYMVYAIHTLQDDPGYGQCMKNGYDSLVVPCHATANISSALQAEMGEPSTNDWLDDWLAEFKGTGSGSVATDDGDSSSFNMVLLVPILLAVAVVIGGVFFVVQRRRKQAAANAINEDNAVVLGYLPPDSKELASNRGSNESRPTMSTTATGVPVLMTARASEDDYTGSSGTSRVLNILFNDPFLKDKRIPLDQIQFQDLLSKGAFGEIWLCRYDNQEVAVKRLLQTKQQSFREIEDFTNEIQLSASLQHPNVVQFIGVAWNSLANLVMIMEYLPRGDLQNYLKKNADLLSWARDKIHMAVGVARALQYIHSHTPPIIHRDLKAKNVLLTERLDVKLIDFGVSRGKQDDMTAGVGTPYWTAPEVLEGTHYTEQSDIYSFGVLLSELDMCELPYFDTVASTGEKLKPFQILKEVMAGSLKPTFSFDCPKRIRVTAEACLQLDPSERPTAQELVGMLEG